MECEKPMSGREERDRERAGEAGFGAPTQGSEYKGKRAGMILDFLANTLLVRTAFTVVMGVTLLGLGMVLTMGSDAGFLPIEIVPVRWESTAVIAAQFSIFFTFLSFITANVLLLRIALSLSFGIGIVSFWISSPPLNLSFVLWYFAILLINLRHVVILLYDRRHLEFDPDREAAYNLVFKKLLTRNSYKTLVSTSLVRVVNEGRDYIKVGDRCENLTLLLSGTIKKTDTTGKVSFVKRGEFMDSPEWIMQTEESGQRFNISFDAETECRVLLWPREMLNDLLGVHPELEGPLLASLGIDVSKKVFRLDALQSDTGVYPGAASGAGFSSDGLFPPVTRSVEGAAPVGGPVS